MPQITTILNWCGAGGVDLKQWPVTHAYCQLLAKAYPQRLARLKAGECGY